MSRAVVPFENIIPSGRFQVSDQISDIFHRIHPIETGTSILCGFTSHLPTNNRWIDNSEEKETVDGANIENDPFRNERYKPKFIFIL